MKTNVRRPSLRTHEGGVAKVVNAEAMLRRAVMSCLLWEKQFYEDGADIGHRIAQLVPHVDGRTVSGIAIEARSRMNLRHVPLLLAYCMTFYRSHVPFVEETLAAIIQRPDELAEYLAIYSRERKGKKTLNKLSSASKRGLARAFRKFNEYQLAKWNQDGAIKLRDVLFLVHPKPENASQAELWKSLAERKLATPDTWEVAISAAKGDKEKTLAEWRRLIAERKLGAMAFIRNLRNMLAAAVPEEEIRSGLLSLKVDRVLPYRFIASARYAPQFEPELELLMQRNLATHVPLPGRTALLVDVSGSMDSEMSGKSEMKRVDAACGLAVLLREIGETVDVYTFSTKTVRITARRGFALRDAIMSSQPHSSTHLGEAVKMVNATLKSGDRIIVISDEQTADTVIDPVTKNAYIINVASYQNGVGYGAWRHIDGFSESVVTWIQELEAAERS